MQITLARTERHNSRRWLAGVPMPRPWHLVEDRQPLRTLCTVRIPDQHWVFSTVTLEALPTQNADGTPFALCKMCRDRWQNAARRGRTITRSTQEVSHV